MFEPFPIDRLFAKTGNAGSPSTSAYARRQEVLGKIMEKRLHDLGNLQETPGKLPSRKSLERSNPREIGRTSILPSRNTEISPKNGRKKNKK